MRLVFRADASRKTGSGHVMRSSVLAEEAISRGLECIFIGKISGLEWVSERISTLGFKQVFSHETSFIPNAATDVLILDSYNIPVSNKFISTQNWKFSMSISDEITPKYSVDIELRPGFEKASQVSVTPVVLSGAEHILIRKGIFKSTRRNSDSSITRVLIVGGGSDPFGFAPTMAKYLDSLKMNLEVHLFTNEKSRTDYPESFIYHPNGGELDIIAQEIDVVLTTASTSSLEFIAREIPTGIVCLAENQEDYYEQLGRLGYAIQIGIRTSGGTWKINNEALNDLLRRSEIRAALRQSTVDLIDLQGAKRVIDFLIDFKSKRFKEDLYF